MIRAIAFICICISIAACCTCLRTEAGDLERSSNPAPVFGRQLQDALSHRRSVSLIGVPLRLALQDLQARTGIAIVLDRRIDPTAPVDVRTEYVTTRDVIEALADACSKSDMTPKIAVSYTENFVYLGPEPAAARLRTLMAISGVHVQELRRSLDDAVFRKLVASDRLHWDDLTEPRMLLTNTVKEAGLQARNPETIPHDLWAGAILPAMTFSDTATLVLNQFDLTFHISPDGVLDISRVPDSITIEKRHRVSFRDQDRVTAAWRQDFPSVNLEWRGSTVTADTTIEGHERLLDIIRGTSPEDSIAAAGLRRRLFTMKALKGTKMGQLIVTLRKSGVPVRIAGKSNADVARLLETPVEFDLTGVPGQQFFPQVFADWDATVRVLDSEVVLTFE